MLLSTTQNRLKTCRLVSKYEILQKYIGIEVMRIVSTNGISYSGIDKNDFNTIVDIFVPSHIRKSHALGLDIGEYRKGSYILRVEAGVEHALSRKLSLSKKLS